MELCLDMLSDEPPSPVPSPLENRTRRVNVGLPGNTPKEVVIISPRIVEPATVCSGSGAKGESTCKSNHTLHESQPQPQPAEGTKAAVKDIRSCGGSIRVALDARAPEYVVPPAHTISALPRPP